MSSAIQILQRAISDGNQPLIQLLRQTKLIAAKLNLHDVETWVDHELKGYPPSFKPPLYRKFHTFQLEIHNPVRGWEFAGNVRMRFNAQQPIAEIENLSKGRTSVMNMPKNLPVQDGLGGGFASRWPQRAIIAASEFKRIVEAVTDELLQWTIELERRGIKGENMEFSENEKQTASNQTFNIQKFTGVLGNVTNSQVTLYDYGSINQLLIDHKIPKQDRHELEDIMDELKDAPPDKRSSLIARGKEWIVKNKELLGATAEAVGKAIGAAVNKT